MAAVQQARLLADGAQLAGHHRRPGCGNRNAGAAILPTQHTRCLTTRWNIYASGNGVGCPETDAHLGFGAVTVDRPRHVGAECGRIRGGSAVLSDAPAHALPLGSRLPTSRASAAMSPHRWTEAVTAVGGRSLQRFGSHLADFRPQRTGRVHKPGRVSRCDQHIVGCRPPIVH
jgi:hypothetical protein